MFQTSPNAVVDTNNQSREVECINSVDHNTVHAKEGGGDGRITDPNENNPLKLNLDDGWRPGIDPF